MYCLFTQSERLQGEAMLKPLFLPFCRLPIPKGVGELIDSKYTLGIATRYFGSCYSLEQT
jgi:hypothetical protein